MSEQIRKLLKERNSYDTDLPMSLQSLRDMHFDRLMRRLCNLFTIENLPFEQHELDTRCFIDGYAAVVKDKIKGIMTAWGGRSGTTQYSDQFTNFTYAAPTAKGGTCKIGENAVLMFNTCTHDSMLIWLMRYAELFAHTDISLRMSLVNSRYQDILKSTSSEKEETLKAWHNGLYKGEMLALIDNTPTAAYLGGKGDIEALSLNTQRDVDFTRYTELENELTRSFYRDLGVRWNKDKKANLVESEVEQDNMLLLYNITDMLAEREKFCEEYNRVFKPEKPISVKLTIPIESVSTSKQEGDMEDDNNNTRLPQSDDE